MAEQESETIIELSNEILRVAAPTNHTHNKVSTSKDGFMSKEDKKKLDTISEYADKTNIVIDSSLPDDTTSTNPVQAKVIMQKINSIKNSIISISNTLNPNSTTETVSAKGIANYIQERIDDNQQGTAKRPFDAGAFNSIDSIIENGIYYIEQNPTNITCGNETINVHQGYMHVKSSINIQTQNIIAPNGIEYCRWKNTSSNNWSNWKIYYMPYRQYNKPITVNTDVYNLEVSENTSGYTFKWNQSLSSDKNYFITSPIAGEWKHVALFQPSLNIDGAHLISTIVGNIDIMITGGHHDGFENKRYDSGIYIRSANGNVKVKGINYSFFVPRNN